MSLHLQSESSDGKILPERKDNSEEQDHKNIVTFPYEIKNVDEKLNTQLLEDFTGERTGFVQVGPKNWLYPSGYAHEAQNIYNFKLRPDDVFVVTFPRSGCKCGKCESDISTKEYCQILGTTWTQEMVWLLCNNLDFEKAAETRLNARWSFLEHCCFFHKDLKEDFLKENITYPDNYKLIQTMGYPPWNTLSESSKQRFIKSHLPPSLLPPNLLQAGCKVIYLARNPKDVAVSFYHCSRIFRILGFWKNFGNFLSYFMRNLVPWTPYWEHLKEGWNMRHENNVLFIFYENMNKNLRKTIEETSAFLGKSYSSHELDKLENHLKFDNFKNNKSVNLDFLVKLGLLLKDEPFIRKGKVGGWKDYFDHDMETEINKWMEENLKDTDLRFPEKMAK